jgi:serine/threonine protein kinase
LAGLDVFVGFGIASRLPRERQSPEPPERIAGTPAYMAPEQTGRMNGANQSRFRENKRAAEEKYLGALVKASMNRRIQCTRCVRFATGVAGVPELGAIYPHSPTRPAAGSRLETIQRRFFQTAARKRQQKQGEIST